MNIRALVNIRLVLDLVSHKSVGMSVVFHK